MVNAIFAKSTLAGLALVALGSIPSYGEVLSSGAIPPSLKINGFTAVNAYIVDQKNRINGKGGPQPHVAVDASNLFFTIMGTSVTGLEYMYRITLETIPGTSSVVDQNYIQIKSKAGTFQFGNTVGPEDSMIWDAGKIIGGTGGFDGGYSNVYNMSAGVVRGNDIIGDTGNATKLVYYSPDMAGFQVGVAYTPSTAHKGDSKLDNTTGSSGKLPGNRGLYEVTGNQPFDLRNVAVGVTYKKESGAWSMTLSAAGVSAKSYFFNSTNGSAKTRVAFRDAKAYQLGAVFGYGDFRFGGGYLDNGRSHLPLSPAFKYGGNSGQAVNLGSMNNGNSGKAWNLGAGYTMGAYQFGASYQRTNRNTGDNLKANSDFYTATIDVTPLQGLKVYTEVDYIRSRSNGPAVARESQFLGNNTNTSNNVGIGSNSALMGIVGTKIAF
jgi:predicted porin